MKQDAHLLVLRFSALGDVAMTVPVLRVLFKTYPQLQVTLVSRPFTAPLFSEFKNLTFYPLALNDRHRGMLGMYRLFKELNTLNITAVADLHHVLRTNLLRGFFLASGQFKWRSIHKGRKEKKALTRPNNKQFQLLTPTVYRYADVFRKLGYPLDLATHDYPDTNSLPLKLQEMVFGNTRKWIGIAPFATHPGKVYPLDLMQKIVGYLDKDYQVFLFGAGPKETKQLEIWAKAFKQVYTTSGKLSFEEQLQLMGHLDLMVAMDSSNGHLAANYNVPVITIWGMTHPFAGFAPFGQKEQQQLLIDREAFPKLPSSIYGNVIPLGYEKAFQTIRPETVLQKIKEQLAARHHRNSP